MVYRDAKGNLKVQDQVTPEEESSGLLLTIFADGFSGNDTLSNIRARVDAQLEAGK